MKLRVSHAIFALVVFAGLPIIPGTASIAFAASCPVTYVDATPCGTPTPVVSASATATVAANGHPAAAAHLSTTCKVASVKHRGLFSVLSSQPVSGGVLEVKLHKVGTPGTIKHKFAVASYSHAITKWLTPGRYHGTMVYIPPSGSAVSYCGIVFRNLRIKKPASRASIKLPTSVSAGLRQNAS